MSVLLKAPSASHASDSGWSHADVRDRAAALLTTEVFPGACLLPLTVFLDATVYPVVVWDRRALEARFTAMVGPATNSEGVWRLEDDEVPTVLRVVGLVGVGAPTATRRALRPLRALARTIAMFPSFPNRSPFVAEEYDAQGTAIVVVDGEKVDVRVGGDAGVRPGSSLSLLWRRIYEERLFDWAMRSDTMPYGLPVVEGLHPRIE